MEVRAVAKYVKVQPRKVRIVADEIRGREAVHSAALLHFHPSKSAAALRKVLISAMANAQENHGVGPESLRIQTIMIDEGPRQKRMRARAMGRGNRILKKTAHITVIVEDFEAKPAIKAHGTKEKPRPTFGAPAKPVASAKPVAVETEEVPVVETAEVEPTEPTSTPQEATPVDASEAPEQDGAAASTIDPAPSTGATTNEENAN